MSQFSVQGGAIEAVARAFANQARDLDRALPGFQSSAYSVNDAFGPWGVSHQMLQEYLDTAHEALKGLHQLVTTLENDAQKLSKVEQNYFRADEASTFGPR